MTAPSEPVTPAQIRSAALVFSPSQRRSANSTIEVVLQLLRGESIEDVSREVGVELHRLAASRDDFLESGKAGLKAERPRSQSERRLTEAERKIGELTMENEILRRAAENGGSRSRRRSGRDSHGRPLSHGSSARRAGRYRFHGVSRRARGDQLGCRPSLTTAVSDEELVFKIRQVLRESSFCRSGVPQGPGPVPPRTSDTGLGEAGVAVDASPRPAGSPGSSGTPQAPAS
jgi:transposase-like protein